MRKTSKILLASESLRLKALQIKSNDDVFSESPSLKQVHGNMTRIGTETGNTVKMQDRIGIQSPIKTQLDIVLRDAFALSLGRWFSGMQGYIALHFEVASIAFLLRFCYHRRVHGIYN